MKLNKTPLVLALMLGALVTVTFLTSAVQAQRPGAPRPGATTGSIGTVVDGIISEKIEPMIDRMQPEDLIVFQTAPEKYFKTLPNGVEIEGVDLLGINDELLDASCCSLEPELSAESAAKVRCVRVCFKVNKKWTVCVKVCKG